MMNPAARFALAALLAGALAATAHAAPVPYSLQPSVLARDMGLPDGAGTLSVERNGSALTADFSLETARGLDDATLSELADRVRRAFPDAEAYHLTAGGRPLASYLAPAPVVTEAARAPGRKAVAPGPLTGKVIALSPGHGWTYYGDPPSWSLQRSYWFGIVEDFMNHEIMQYTYNLLVNSGATVYVTREIDKAGGTWSTPGELPTLIRPTPNKPWWQMAALYYTAKRSSDDKVYKNGGSNDYNSDIRSRPLYANHVNADIMVSLHNNALNGQLNPDGSVRSEGTATGTETLYDNANGHQVNSQRLAQLVQSKVISQLRSNWVSNWSDRGAKGFNGSYGENRIATRPACLIEVAFFDHRSPDNNGLQDERFKMLVAKGMYEGICAYFNVTPRYTTNINAPDGAFTATSWPRRWALKLDTSATPGSPISAPVSSSDGWVYAATEAGVVYGVETTALSGATRWRYPTAGNMGAPVLARPTVYNDAVYVVSAKGRLAALDRATGAARWTATVPNRGALVTSPSATPRGTVVIGSDNGFLYAYSQQTGELLQTSPVAFGPINAQAAIPDAGHVWVGSDDGKVRCVTGDLSVILWETQTGAAVPSAPYVLTSNNAVYVTNAARRVFAFNASNGGPAEGWPAAGLAFGYNITSSPWADAATDTVLFGMENHSISGLSADGYVPESLPIRPAGVKEFTAAPVRVGDMVYVGGTDGKLYALQLSNGEADPIWRVFDTAAERLPGQFRAAAALTGTDQSALVVAGNTNGYLYALPR